MKKTLFLFLSVLLILLSFSAIAFANSNQKVIVDGSELSFDVSPQIINGRTMVPAREVFEALGASVSWDEKTQTMHASKLGFEIDIMVNSNIVTVNNANVPMDVNSTIIENRIMIPIRYIAGSLNYPVVWYPKLNTVSVKTEKSYNNIDIDSHIYDVYGDEKTLSGFAITSTKISDVRFDSCKRANATIDIEGYTVGTNKTLKFYLCYYSDNDYLLEKELVVKSIDINDEFSSSFDVVIPDGTRYIKFKPFTEYELNYSHIQE